MPISISFDEISPLLDGETLILTPNSRTQKALISGYMRSMAVGDVVRAPEIISTSQWLEKLWQSLSFKQVLPTIVGDLEIKTWLKDIIKEEDKWQLTNALGVAEKVLEAYRNLRLWNKNLNHLDSLETPENHYFVSWATELETFLKQNNLTPRFLLADYLLKILCTQPESLQQELPRQILLVGFNQMTPLEECLFDKCKDIGVLVKKIQRTEVSASVAKIQAIDLKQELEIAANYSRSLTKDNPELSIGIVVQQLSSHLPLIHQVFSDSFHPQESMPWQAVEKTSYNVSAGQPLADIPMINAAIQLLQLQSAGFELQALSFLKNSPFISWGENEGTIKRFLHEQSLLAFSHYSFNYLLNAIEQEAEPELLGLLVMRINELKNRESYSRPMSAWSDYWKSILDCWGWLGKQSLDSSELKIHSEFLASLKDCLNISFIYQKLTNVQAKDYLFQVLRQKVFQSPSDRTNIQVLGVLEAAGLEFDELILVGFNRDNWPQKHKINPFIPIVFQQQHDMPGSSASREYEYAKDLSGSLLTGARKILITFSQPDDDNLSSESAFFSDYPLSSNQLEELLGASEKISPHYHWVKDEKIQLSASEVKGGAYLLSQYATCPFKAMSRFLLKIKSAEMPHKGIEPRIKGAWLHLVMELIWNELKTQDALLSLEEVEVNDLVKRLIAKAKLDFDAQLTAGSAAEVVEIEMEKMQIQVLQWLQLERLREPFEVTTEVEKELVLGKLKFKFRVDRIDKNEKGKLEIIDYKTGSVEVKKWLGKRPEEAQMPAYVLACEDEMPTSTDNIQSLTYAKIKTGEVSSNGVYFEKKSENGFRFIEQSLDNKKDRTKYILTNKNLIELDKSLASQWRKNLQNIANKIVAGEMPVSPKSEVESCRFCEFGDFCRIAESQPASESESVHGGEQ